MTVSSQVKKNTYSGDGSTVAFAFSFPILDETHLLVQIKDTNGDITAKTLNTHYTISGTGNELTLTNYASGTVTFEVADTPAATDTVIISRNVPLTQATDYVENDPFPAETHEKDLDKSVMIDLQQQEVLDRSVRFDIGVSTTIGEIGDPTADYYLKRNANNDGWEWAAQSGDVVGPSSATDNAVVRFNGTTGLSIQNSLMTVSDAGVINIPTGADFKINSVSILSETTLGSSVTASSLTSVGTLSSLQVDYININGNTISSTSGAVNITPVAGQAIVLDGTISVDAGVVTGATSITSTAFVGNLTGNADTVTTNANLTGEVTSTGNAAVLDVSAIGNQSTVTAASGDYLLIKDATDGTLKKVDANDFLTGGGLANVVEDLTPQLGGNLDTNGFTVAGRNIATDGTKLDGIEALADVTDEANVVAALDGATLTAVTVATTDKVLLQDVSDLDNIKTVTAQSIANLVADTTVAGDSGSTAITPGDTLTIAGGTNATTAMSGDTLTVNVDDAFILNTGDVGTGVYDFGGATSFEIPNGTSGTTNVAGQVYLDTNGDGVTITTGVMQIYDGTQNVYVVAAKNFPSSDNDVPAYDSATNSVLWQAQAGVGGGISNVVEDLTPQLGGDLDMNGNQITSPDGTDLIDIPNGSIDLQTNSTSRLDISDTGVRLGAANARVTTILDEDTMTSNSATALCTQQSIKAYVDSQSGGGWTQLATATASASATIELTGMTGYTMYVVAITDMVGATDVQALQLRTSSNGGSSYDSAASDYKYAYSKGISSSYTVTGSTGAAQIKLTATEIGNASGEGFNGLIYVFKPSTTSHYPMIRLVGGYLSGATVSTINDCIGHRVTTSGINALQFFMTSGNIASGTFTLYGIV